MIKGLKEIMEGWRNRIIPPEKLKEKINEIAAKRLEICRACEYDSLNAKPNNGRIDEHCTYCGCTLYFKTACLSCSCPLNKWTAELDPQEDEQLRKDMASSQNK